MCTETKQLIYQVDAFTGRPFAGNPAAVCILDQPRDEEWMRAVAREMNLSETAFLVPHADEFGLRWFTPAVEVDLCGHATLASAHILWETARLERGRQARFHTRSGLLTATQARGWIELDFPSTPPAPEAAPPALVEALGAQPRFEGKSRFDYLLVFDSEEEIRRLNPDFGRMRQVKVRGVIVSARASSPGYDFVSRFFAPGSGIDEDPVTGSSHCCLTPYWASILGKKEMFAYQASARGGEIRVGLQGDRVILAGQAVTVLKGELLNT